jgi:septal ring factor EnvC (AmiA/AmiB activator)
MIIQSKFDEKLEKIDKKVDSLNIDFEFIKKNNFSKNLKKCVEKNEQDLENVKNEIEDLKQEIDFLKIEIDKTQKDIPEFKEKLFVQIKNYIDKIKKEKEEEKKWRWSLFFVGLSKFGITDGTILSIILISITQLIQYLELLNIPEEQTYLVSLSGFSITILKSLKQVIKELKKKNVQ